MSNAQCPGTPTLIMFVAFACSLRAQPLPATASVQIVNATSVPAITLKINERLIYPNFPQGLKAADSPTSVLNAVYEVEDIETRHRAKSAQINYQAGSNQSLVILGDFSTDAPARLRVPNAGIIEERPHDPKVLFQVFSHASTEAPVRLRIINGMPGKHLTFVAGRYEVFVEPGNSAVLTAQPATAQYLAKVDGEQISVLMRQERRIRNAMIIFFLQKGHPAFMRAFENKSDWKPEQLQSE